MAFIEKLKKPEEVPDGIGGTIKLTHKAFGFKIEPWAENPILTYTVLGVLDSDGNFRAYDKAPVEYIYITKEDAADVMKEARHIEKIIRTRRGEVREKMKEARSKDMAVMRADAEQRRQESHLLETLRKQAAEDGVEIKAK